MLTAMLSRTPAPMAHHADVPSELDALVARCLDRDADARYPDVVALSEELARMLAIEDSTKTQMTRAPSGPRTAPQTVPTLPEPRAEDSLTWIDKVPPANPVTTLPGVVPPSPGTPWPFDDPKKRPKR